eukprot:SAG11_NODE_273_length_11315_cov_38.599412_3_plen_86_part_00
MESESVLKYCVWKVHTSITYVPLPGYVYCGILVHREIFEFFFFFYDIYPPLVTTYTRDPASRVSTRGTQDCAILDRGKIFPTRPA